MHTNFERLQKDYPVFRYVAANFDVNDKGLIVEFHFEIGEHKFSPKLLFHGITQASLSVMDPVVLKRFVFNLGLAEIPSYWKLTCSPKVLIEAGYINPAQVIFWQKLMEKGLGEFFFVNDIKPFAPVFEVATEMGMESNHDTPLPLLSRLDQVLVPVGGGKDSVVSLELLHRAGKAVVTFTIGDNQSSDDIISVYEKKYGKVGHLHVERILDPSMLELNARGYLNGHTPFSSIVAFSSLLMATLKGIPLIALSNEKSANEETGVYQGVNINHQYSKTFEFETDFRQYVEATFARAPVYFSLLRPLYEIQIMKIFSKYPEYFKFYRSCNIGKKTNSWCGDCAKCLFVSLLMSAFLPPKTVSQIFNKDILADVELVPLLKQLTGDAPMKAFECVGTKAETLTALYMAWKRRGKEEPLPALLKLYETKFDKDREQLEKMQSEILRNFDMDNLIPENLVESVHHEIY